VSEGGQSTYRGCLHDLILIIVEIEESLQHLIGCEVGSVSWNAATSDNLGSFPKSQEALLSVEYRCSLEKTQP
jgi:hypothetical protein